MKFLSYIVLFGGLAAVVALVAWQGFATVAGIVPTSGQALLLPPRARLPHLLFGAASRSVFSPVCSPKSAGSSGPRAIL